MADLDHVLEPDYLGDLAARPLDEIRAMRAECLEIETGLSYLRRMVQGRADIVTSEQERRASGGPASELPELIGQLPEIFSEHRRPGGTGRLPQSLDPPEPDPELVAELDGIASASRLAELPELAEVEVAAIAGRLQDLERRVSDMRRAMFERLDALQEELARRYRSGEASVESLLSEG